MLIFDTTKILYIIESSFDKFDLFMRVVMYGINLTQMNAYFKGE